MNSATVFTGSVRFTSITEAANRANDVPASNRLDLTLTKSIAGGRGEFMIGVLDVLDECRRVLRPNGMIRVGVPDFGRYIESYAGDRHFIEENRPGRPTPLIAVGEVALAHGHRSVWDAITLEGMLAEAGFVEVSVRAFGDSQLEPPPDTPMREPETLYAEGRKPDAQATSATAD